MVWARSARYVSAVDNTDMYLPKVRLRVNDERSITVKLAPDLLCLCETLLDRGDPEFMFSTRVALDLTKESPTHSDK